MAIIDIKSLSSHKAKFTTLLGIDLGEKTIGLALSDRNWMIASPMETLKRDQFSKDWPKLEN